MPYHWDDRQHIRRLSNQPASRRYRDVEPGPPRYDYDTRGRIGQEGGYHGQLTGYTSYPYGQQGYYSEPTRRGPAFGEHGPEYGEPGPGHGEREYGNPLPGTHTEPWRIPGPFTGRGPRGYTRSDERIHEEVCEFLTAHGYLDASDIEVDVNNGEVTLRGTVPNRQAKRIAEDAAISVRGVRDVHNRLRIEEEPRRERAVEEGENPLGGVDLKL